MPALAHQFARLIGSFHGIFSAAARPAFRSASVGVRDRSSTQLLRAGGPARLARLIRKPFSLVNATPQRLAGLAGCIEYV
jgi:hypothetical protein